MNALNSQIAQGFQPTADFTMARRGALGNALMEQQLQAQPQRMDLAEREMQLRQLALDLKAKALSSTGTGEPVSIDSGDVTITGLPDKVAMVADAVARYPEQAKDPGFMPWVASQGVSFKKKGEVQKEPRTLDVETWVTPSGQTVNLQKGQMPPAGSVPYKGKGMDIQFDPETGRPISISQGGMPGTGQATVKTKGAIEEKLLGGKEQLARMSKISEDFKPEYQQTGTRLRNAWTGIKASLGKDVSPEDAKGMTEFKKFQRKAIENINLYIKEITGAQMSEQEASRLRLAQPDPGEKWYQGDDPISFKAKMDDVVRSTRASIARYEYYKAKGLEDSQIKAIVNTGTAIPLDSLSARMD